MRGGEKSSEVERESREAKVYLILVHQAWII